MQSPLINLFSQCFLVPSLDKHQINFTPPCVKKFLDITYLPRRTCSVFRLYRWYLISSLPSSFGLPCHVIKTVQPSYRPVAPNHTTVPYFQWHLGFSLIFTPTLKIYNACIHTYMHRTYLHTYIPLYLHTYLPNLPTYLATYLHAYIPTYLHTYIRTYLHTYIRTYIHRHIYNYMHIYMYTYIYIYM